MDRDNRAPRGRYKGEPLDDSSRHSIRLRGQAVDYEAADSCNIDFFYHAGEFWTAVVPLHGVAEILGQAFNFSKPKTRKGPEGPEVVYDAFDVPLRKIPYLNHLQTRFRMQPQSSVELYPLGNEPTGDPVHRIDDFVYSVEAVGPTGVGFGIRDGLNGSLVSAHRFLSTEEIVFERIVVEGQYVKESPPLPVSDPDKRKLLVEALLRSDRAGMSESYYLYRCCATNNCTSNPFQLLDRTVKYGLKQRVAALLFRLPLSPRFYLRVRGMDPDPAHQKLLRHEFESYVSDPETQKRKREYVRTKIKALRAARKQRRPQ